MFFMRRPICAPLLATVVLLAACAPQPDQQENRDLTANATIPATALPVADPPMDRSAMLIAVARAASATALGLKDSGQRQLDGKRFEVRIRFGCRSSTDLRAAASSQAPFGIRFDPKGRTLRLRATPDITIEDSAVAALAGDKVEAVEGFWMYRPWLLDAGCTPIPAAPPTLETPGEEPSDEAPSEPVTEAASKQSPSWRVGLVQFFTTDDARTGRRDDRAFETTAVLKPDEQPSPQGYNLVLSGRLRQLPDGRVIACRVERPTAPPECVVSARFDHIKIEKPDDRAVIAEWSQ